MWMAWRATSPCANGKGMVGDVAAGASHRVTPSGSSMVTRVPDLLPGCAVSDLRFGSSRWPRSQRAAAGWVSGQSGHLATLAMHRRGRASGQSATLATSPKWLLFAPRRGHAPGNLAAMPLGCARSVCVDLRIAANGEIRVDQPPVSLRGVHDKIDDVAFPLAGGCQIRESANLYVTWSRPFKC